MIVQGDSLDFIKNIEIIFILLFTDFLLDFTPPMDGN
jgi:hypothetical protein